MSRIPQHLVWMSDPYKPTVAGQRRLGSRLRRWWYRHEDLFLLGFGALVLVSGYIAAVWVTLEALKGGR